MDIELKKLFRQLNKYQFNEHLLGTSRILNEDSALTYYELRQFITLLYKTISDKDTKSVLGEILKSLTVMELRKLPVPTIKKLKSQSPKIFQ